MVGLLLDNGAIARPHYYTKYSPLYIACHMGNLPIAKMILDKFPHLIAVPTIENFLPFHAACSQGHLEILKLLIDSINSNINLQKLFTDDQQHIYIASFNLNEQDMNGHTGLHSAVLANHYHVCLYLLEMRLGEASKLAIQKLKKQEIKVSRSLKKNEQKNKVNLSESDSIQSNTSLSGNNAVQQQQQISLFDHLKNVFLDPRSYDPYVVNYTAADSNIEDKNSTDRSVDAFILSSLIGEGPANEPVLSETPKSK